MSKAGMSIPISCACGQVRGEADAARVYVRATCYCRHCQAYARWLGTPGMLDAGGGTDIVAMAPAGLRFTAGTGHIACVTLTGKVYRWYAACCRTPLGNTARDPGLQYVGMCTACMPDGAALDAALGPAGRCLINTGSATTPVRPTPLAFLLGGLRIAAGILGARMRGQRRSPFFDETTGQPLRTPEKARRTEA